MNARPTRRRSACNVTDARARLHDADAFLEIAEVATDADVVATNAIHAAIAAADAICCIALRERSADGSHAAATQLLARVDGKLANTLSRCLDRKNQAAYESRDVATKDAANCVSLATTLVEAARLHVLST